MADLVDRARSAVSERAELPGMSEKEVQVEIANGVLSIRGENWRLRSSRQ